MKTYRHEAPVLDMLYWYDPFIKCWILKRINSRGKQIGGTEHYQNKQRLAENYPFLKFEPVKKTTQLFLY